MEKLTQEILKELLDYNESTGIFTWIERTLSAFAHCKYPTRACNIWNSRFTGTEAGTKLTTKIGKTSYMVIGISLDEKKKLYYAHRLAILYTDGHFPSEQVDHIDGNGLNNRRDNLREVSNKENQKNKPMPSNNTSGTVGVRWNKERRKWHSQIKVNGKYINGGFFLNKSDAIQERKQLEIEYKFHSNHGRKQGDK